MKIQAIQNYNSRNKNNQSKCDYPSTTIPNPLTRVDSFQKNNYQQSFGLGPGAADMIRTMEEAEKRGYWKINGLDILNASVEKLKDLAESFHILACDSNILPSDIYTVKKNHWFWGFVDDEIRTQKAHDKFIAAIQKVVGISNDLEAKIDAKTATKDEIAEFLRLQEKARSCRKDYHTKGGDI